MYIHFAHSRVSCLFLVRLSIFFNRESVNARKLNASFSYNFHSFNWRCISFLYFSRAVIWVSISKKLATEFKVSVRVFFLGLCIVNNCVLLAATLVTFLGVDIHPILNIFDNDKSFYVCVMAAFQQLGIQICNEFAQSFLSITGEFYSLFASLVLS